MDKDLELPIPDEVLKNQASPTGTNYIISIDGVLTPYAHLDDYRLAERFDKKLQSEIDWVEKFTSHAPSVGSHYERILSDLCAEYLPKQVCIGTGFVYDTLRESASPQIDLLFYEDSRIAPIYRRSDFVIVQPQSVLMTCEIKKSLAASELRSWIRKTVGCNLGTARSNPSGVQNMAVFAYDSNATTNNLVSKVAEELENFLRKFHMKTKGGDLAVLSIFHLCLPKIYIRGREEYVSARVERLGTDSNEARIKILVHKSLGPSGVSPFLGLLSSMIDTTDPEFRDFTSSFLLDTVDEVSIDVPVHLETVMTSSQLLKYFPEAKPILQSNQAHSIRFSSFENPLDHDSFNSFANTPGFSWVTVSEEARSGSKE